MLRWPAHLHPAVWVWVMIFFFRIPPADRAVRVRHSCLEIRPRPRGYLAHSRARLNRDQDHAGIMGIGASRRLWPLAMGGVSVLLLWLFGESLEPQNGRRRPGAWLCCVQIHCAGMGRWRDPPWAQCTGGRSLQLDLTCGGPFDFGAPAATRPPRRAILSR